MSAPSPLASTSAQLAGEFSGWCLKDAPRGGDVDKLRSTMRRLLHDILPPRASFKLRFFVLRGMELSYYRRHGTRLVAHGVIDLATIAEARPVDALARPSAPPAALELVTDARVFTIAPHPPSAELAGAWLQRIRAKLDASRRTGMLTRSLRSVSSLVHGAAANPRSSSRASRWGGAAASVAAAAAAAVVGGTSSVSSSGGGDAAPLSPSAIAAAPMYLSHEACRLAPEALAVAGGSINVLAAGGGASASSGLLTLLTSAAAGGSAPALAIVAAAATAPVLLPPPGDGIALPSMTAAVNALVLSSLPLHAGGRPPQQQQQQQQHEGAAVISLERDVTSRLSFDDNAGGAGDTMPHLVSGGGASAASAVTALGASDASVPSPTLGAASLLGLDPASARQIPRLSLSESTGGLDSGLYVHQPHHAALLRRGSSVFATGDFSALPLRAVSIASGAAIRGAQLFNRKASSSELLAAPWGSSSASAGGSAAAGSVRRRRLREVSKWEEMSGNVPRWATSACDEHRWKHTPAFASLLGLGEGHQGFTPTEAAASVILALEGVAARKGRGVAGGWTAASPALSSTQSPVAVTAPSFGTDDEGDDDGDRRWGANETSSRRSFSASARSLLGLHDDAPSPRGSDAIEGASLRSGGSSSRSWRNLLRTSSSPPFSDANSSSVVGEGSPTVNTSGVGMGSDVLMLNNPAARGERKESPKSPGGTRLLQSRGRSSPHSVAAIEAAAAAEAATAVETSPAATLQPGARGPELALLAALSEREARFVAALQVAAQKTERARGRTSLLLGARIDPSQDALLQCAGLSAMPLVASASRSPLRLGDARAARCAALIASVPLVSHQPTQELTHQRLLPLRQQQWLERIAPPSIAALLGNKDAQLARWRGGAPPALSLSSGAAANAPSASVWHEGDSSWLLPPLQSTTRASAHALKRTLQSAITAGDDLRCHHHSAHGTGNSDDDDSSRGDASPPALKRETVFSSDNPPTRSSPEGASSAWQDALDRHHEALAGVEAASVQQSLEWNRSHADDDSDDGCSSVVSWSAGGRVVLVVEWGADEEGEEGGLSNPPPRAPMQSLKHAQLQALREGTHTHLPNSKPEGGLSSPIALRSVLPRTGVSDVSAGGTSGWAPRYSHVCVSPSTDTLSLPWQQRVTSLVPVLSPQCVTSPPPLIAVSSSSSSSSPTQPTPSPTILHIASTLALWLEKGGGASGDDSKCDPLQRLLTLASSSSPDSSNLSPDASFMEPFNLWRDIPANGSNCPQGATPVALGSWLGLPGQSIRGANMFEDLTRTRGLPPIFTELPRTALQALCGADAPLGLARSVRLLAFGEGGVVNDDSRSNGGGGGVMMGSGAPTSTWADPSARAVALVDITSLEMAHKGSESATTLLSSVGSSLSRHHDAEAAALARKIDLYREVTIGVGRSLIPPLPSLAADPLEIALSHFRFHVARPGTVLHVAAAADGPAPVLLGHPRSLYILLHGRVRLHTPFRSSMINNISGGSEGIARPSSSTGRRLWRRLRTLVHASAQLRRAGLNPWPQLVLTDAADSVAAVDTSAPPLAGAGVMDEDGAALAMPPPAPTTSSLLPFTRRRLSSAAPSTAAAAAAAVATTTAPPPMPLSLGMAVGMACGEVEVPAANAGVWLELNALAAPIILGAPQLLHAQPHGSTVTVVSETGASEGGGALLLELPPPFFTTLAHALPSFVAGLALPALPSLCGLGGVHPHRLVACIPALVAAFADTRTSRGAGAGGAGASLSVIHPSERFALLSSICALFRPVLLSPGEALWTPGDWGDAAYVVLSGRVAVSVGGGGAPTTSSSSSPPTTSSPRLPSPPTPFILAVHARGSCLGESALLGAPAVRRSTNATALSSCVLLRLSAASLRGLLAPLRPRLWRTIAAALHMRSPVELARVPLLSWIAGGGDAGAASVALGPLSDLFAPVVLVGREATLSNDGTSSSSGGSKACACPTPTLPLIVPPGEWDVGSQDEGIEDCCCRTSGGTTRKGLGAAPPWELSPRAVLSPLVDTEALGSLFCVAHGDAEWMSNPHSVTSFAPTPASLPPPLPLRVGDWLGGSTLYRTPAHGAPPGALRVAGGAPDGFAVLLALPRHRIDAFAFALPNGLARLQQWREVGLAAPRPLVAVAPVRPPRISSLVAALSGRA